MARLIMQNDYQYLQETLKIVVRFGSSFFVVLIADIDKLLYKSFWIKDKF